jgi:hypothetical protein
MLKLSQHPIETHQKYFKNHDYSSSFSFLTAGQEDDADGK